MNITKKQNEKFDIRKIHGDAAGLYDVGGDYCDHDDDDNNEKFGARKVHGDAVGLRGVKN